MRSFSNYAKEEMCATASNGGRRRALLAGALLSARHLRDDCMVLQTECEAFAGLFPAALRAICPSVTVDTEYRARTRRLPLWVFTIQGKSQVETVMQAFGLSNAGWAALLERFSTEERAAFVAGMFVMNGSVTNPAREYHLEFALPTPELAEMVRTVLQAVDIIGKLTVRKGETIFYLKHNERIGDALTFLGAPNATIQLIGAQVVKSVREQTNRRTNCDLANIDKTVRAVEQQAADIHFIAQTVGLQTLPDTLRTLAQARLEHPDACLRELGAVLTPPISRSGVNHRLQRIAAIAATLRAAEKKGESQDEKKGNPL